MDVTINQKRGMIEWFLDEYDMKQREITWLLEYLIKRDHLLEKIRFVYEAHLCHRSLIISVDDSDSRPFRFYKEHIVTTDVDKAFHDVRLNTDELMYVELKFPGIRQTTEYAEVLEDNPYLPDDYYMKNEDYQSLEKLWTEMDFESKKSDLLQKIDDALDCNDKEAFLKWSKEIEKLSREDKNFN
ncbi:hypothetical protein CEY16_03565 [Halalkalibacillus sediminis]|uniref:UPF0302 protein CEY16_03565 n=1 Tax=Halalkalibacillus sediminis TaxID=2018042 RepID=A0A2I0QWZ8_9BACI|nr:ReoY family proteolytic degradation factor [Halalkalibacillus sediminis]PKR78844.1 hypothetical protein CEY16_03565 [Halalkalibacillus sediminis]